MITHMYVTLHITMKVKTALTLIVLIAVVMTGMYYGQDIVNVFRHTEYVQLPPTTEIVVTDEFAALVTTFSESPEGKEVLHTWATQQALEVTRKKLDDIEAQTLRKEASV